MPEERDPVANVLVLTADLPYFPGKMGVDFFNLRHLAARHRVGVIAPVYAQFPESAVENLRRNVQATYFWPEPRPDLVPNPPAAQNLRLRRPLRLLPRSLRRALLHRLLGLRRGDHDGLVKLAVLSILAPYVLAALADGEWDALVIIQSDTRPWLDYLPPHLAVAVYFHDVRSHYLARRAPFERRRLSFERRARLAERQEREIARRVDAVGFVSELDLGRARAAFGPLPEPRVAPIPIDLAYYTPRPEGFARDGRQVVLFTGHLTHPPNVDAALYFLREVWPRVRARHPRAVFQVAGAMPSEELQAACRATPGVELHADVPDIRPFFWNAGVYVVPMRYGGGVRQKILEAWAMEVPVALTPMAGEGSPARDGVNAFVAGGAQALAERVSALLERPGEAAAVIARARDEVRAGHAVAEASAGFEELVLGAIEARRRRPLRVLLDLAWLRPDDESPSAGEARALVSALLRLDLRRHYHVLAPAATLRALELPASSRVRALATDGAWARSRRLRSALAALLADSLPTHQPMGAAMRRLELLHWLDADLAHAFDPARPRLSALLPSVVGVPAGATRLAAQDPEWERAARAACRVARAVACAGEDERLELCARFGLQPRRVRVVPPPDAGDWAEPARHVMRLYDAAAGRAAGGE
jgi:glycosyltransferase involved in cell wall biosynthesis